MHLALRLCGNYCRVLVAGLAWRLSDDQIRTARTATLHLIRCAPRRPFVNGGLVQRGRILGITNLRPLGSTFKVSFGLQAGIGSGGFFLSVDVSVATGGGGSLVVWVMIVLDGELKMWLVVEVVIMDSSDVTVGCRAYAVRTRQKTWWEGLASDLRELKRNC